MPKLLIVEDDQIVATIFRNKFAADGYVVEVVADAESGLELLPKFQPSVVLLDLVLPNMSGVDFIRAVRALEAYKSLPVVVFSNTYQSNLIQEARLAGATKCLAKANYTPKQVIDIVGGVIANGASAASPSTATAGRALSPKAPSPSRAHPAPASGPQPSTLNPQLSSGNVVDDSEAEVRAGFIRSLPAALQELRGMLKALIKATSEKERLDSIDVLYRRIRGLGAHAAVGGVFLIAQVAEAIEALLKELHEKPKSINPSTLRTVATAVDFLGVLSQKGLQLESQEVPAPKILVVDDEAISRRAIVHALAKAKLQAVNVGDSNLAYSLLESNPFDLIFLDVDMPGMTGFELCAKLRKLPGHTGTPVVFVTNLNDFENRANSTISGGNDFIGKPFLFIELALKALIYVLKNRLD